MICPAAMKMEASPYPGSEATPAELLKLAVQYRAAAQTLRRNGKRGRAYYWAPFRLCSLQAIELCLSAGLRHAGADAKLVRGMQHRLAERLELFDPMGTLLKARTRERMTLLEEKREYLVVRYAPTELKQTLHPDTVLAIAAEVEEVTRKLLSSGQPARPAPSLLKPPASA